MTTTNTDPSTTPAEPEREARVKQAHDFLALAMTPEHLSTWGGAGSGQINYENGIQAVRDALVGQGYALAAIHAELADIAASLRALAALPSAVHCVATQVSDGLSEVRSQVHDLTATIDVGVEYAGALQDLVDVADRPRWWQWRRWSSHRLRATAVTDASDLDASE